MHPFSDLTALELCRADSPLHIRLALAMAGKLLAQLGAGLVCIEPIGADPLDSMSPVLADGRSAVGAFLKAGKQLLSPASESEVARAVAALTESGLAVVLLAEGDPLRPGLAQAGVAVIELATWPADVAPDLASAPASEFGVMAAGGILDMIGEPDRTPLRLAGHQVAYAAGLSAFTAATAAITQRDLDGHAFSARVSLLETAVWMNWKAVVGAAGDGPLPSRKGDRAEFQVLSCADGWVAFVYTANQFDRVRQMLGEHLLDDERFRSRAGREASVREFMAAVRPWFRSRTREQIYAEARRHGVPLGPVYSPRELLSDPQFAARDFISGDDATGLVRFPRLPATWNAARLRQVPARRTTLRELESAGAGR